MLIGGILLIGIIAIIGIAYYVRVKKKKGYNPKVGGYSVPSLITTMHRDESKVSNNNDFKL